MSVAIKKKEVSFEEYDEWAERQEGKYEYWHGTIVPLRVHERDRLPEDWKVEWGDDPLTAMAGGTTKHGVIIRNILTDLDFHLRGRECRAYTSDTGIYSEACNDLYYPDVSLICGQPDELERKGVINPIGLVEVLSRSTEEKDRTTKLTCYQSMETVQFVLLVSQKTPRIDAYFRTLANEWVYVVAIGREAVLYLPSIELDLRLSEVYARVEFEKENTD